MGHGALRGISGGLERLLCEPERLGGGR
jgi:hypothetical protein